jgi:hypothetical protein
MRIAVASVWRTVIKHRISVDLRIVDFHDHVFWPSDVFHFTASKPDRNAFESVDDDHIAKHNFLWAL